MSGKLELIGVVALLAVFVGAALPLPLPVHLSERAAFDERVMGNGRELGMAGQVVGREGEAARVRVAFYTESLCPDCRNFTLGALATAFHNGVSDVMDIDLVPYGNAWRDKVTGNLHCQHGPEECTFNKVFGCAVHMYPEQRQWFRFLHCMERQKALMMRAALQGCAQGAGMEAAKIDECASGPLGAQLELEYAQRTEALVPAHTFVPWVTVNDVPLWMDVDSLEQYVCAAYMGQRPPACFRSKENVALRHWGAKVVL